MNRKAKGFTLLEVIIVMAISAIAMTLIVSIFITGVKIFSNSDVKTTLQMDAKDIQENISDIIMQGSKAEIISDGIKVSQVNEGTEKSIEIKKNGNELYIDKLDLSGNEIANTKSILTTNLADCNFELKDNSVKVIINLEKKSGYANEKYPIKFTVTFRNKS